MGGSGRKSVGGVEWGKEDKTMGRRHNKRVMSRGVRGFPPSFENLIIGGNVFDNTGLLDTPNETTSQPDDYSPFGPTAIGRGRAGVERKFVLCASAKVELERTKRRWFCFVAG